MLDIRGPFGAAGPARVKETFAGFAPLSCTLAAMPVAHSLRFRRRLAGAFVLAAALLSPAFEGATLAQGKDPLARMRERFREAVALENGGNCADALKIFKEVAEVKSTPQVRIHIAKCEEKTGDYIRALGSYRLTLTEAEEKKLADIIQAAKDSIAALEPKIPALTIERGEGATVAPIQFDDHTLGATEVGVAMPVNPGPHVISASTDGRQPFRAELNVSDGEKKTVVVKLLPIEAPPDVTAPPEPTTPPEKPTSSGVKTAGFIVGALGVVGLGVGATFLGLRQGTLDELEGKCGADHKSCPPDAQSLIDQGGLYATGGSALLIGGGVVLAAGLIMILVAPKPVPPTVTTRLQLTPSIALSPRGGALRFEF